MKKKQLTVTTEKTKLKKNADRFFRFFFVNNIFPVNKGCKNIFERSFQNS